MAERDALSMNGSFLDIVNSTSMCGNLSLAFANGTNLNMTCMTSHCDCTGDVISDGLTCACDDTPDNKQPFIPWNNHDIISLKTLQLIEQVVMCYVNVILLAVGVPTNILNAIVFYRQGLCDRMNLCLFSLSIADMFVVLLWFLLGSFCFAGYYLDTISQNLWKWNVRKYLRGFHRGFYFSSGCLTMIVAVERCVCVALPFKANTLVRTRTMAILILSTILTLHVFCSVYLVTFDVAEIVDPATNNTVVILPPTNAYLANRHLIDTMENTVIMVAIPFTTFSVVSIATLVTVIKIKQSISWRETSASSSSFSRSQTALVKMLIIVSCIYITTSAPNVALGIVRSLVPDFWLTGKFANIFVATHILYLVLGTLNSTVNFFVYVSRSSRFRCEVVRMVTCRMRATQKNLNHNKPANNAA